MLLHRHWDGPCKWKTRDKCSGDEKQGLLRFSAWASLLLVPVDDLVVAHVTKGLDYLGIANCRTMAPHSMLLHACLSTACLYVVYVL